MPQLAAKPICRYVNTGIFSSPEYLALSQDGTARLLMLFLLIHPHGGAFHVPGLYQVGPSALQEVCRLPARAFARAYAELQQSRIIRVDSAVRLIWMPAALSLIGPPANPNMVKGFCRSIRQMPACPLLDEAIAFYRTFLHKFGQSFSKPFAEAFDLVEETVTHTIREPLANGLNEVCETYINSNSNRDRYNHINNHPVREASAIEINDEPARAVRRFAEWAKWPLPPLEALKFQADDLPGLTEGEMREAQALLAGREGIRDRWAYLFAVVRRTRSGHPLEQGQLIPVGDGEDPFASFSDGQEVNFRDP